MIEAGGLTKRYGETTAVNDLSFSVKPGIVTGFLGPNGSGKSTTMRLVLGLDAPTSGDVTVAGKHYAEHPAPLHEVGALLEARSVHTGRSAYNHLLSLAQTHGIPLEVNFAGVQLAQLAIGVLGVLVMTAEYSTGMIRASFTAVPKRLPVLWGKAVVYAATTLALMVPAVLLSFVIVQSILSRRHIEVAFGAPHVARAVLGAALYLTVVGLFALGLEAIVRNTAGGIAAFAGVMFVLPPLMNVLPTSWNDAASPYLPLAAGEAIMAATPGNHLAPWLGLLLFSGYAAAAIGVAGVLLTRRDV
jgi:ABC-2 type transport system permease protein